MNYFVDFNITWVSAVQQYLTSAPIQSASDVLVSVIKFYVIIGFCSI